MQIQEGVKAKVRLEGVGALEPESLQMMEPREACQKMIRGYLSAGGKLGTLAKKANINSATISKLYYGETVYPREETLRRILRIFGWSLLAVRGLQQ